MPRTALVPKSAAPARASAVPATRDPAVLDPAVFDPAGLGPLERVPLIGDIRRLMLAHRPRYFHFSGHGSAVGTLELEGSAAPVTLRAGDLMRVLELTGLPDCVVLNACYTASAVDDLGEAIPYTVLMSDRVHDDAALCFSRCFYAALAGGLGVEDAFELSRIELRAGGHDADVPLLFLHGKELGAVDRPRPASPR